MATLIAAWFAILIYICGFMHGMSWCDVNGVPKWVTRINKPKKATR